MADDKGGGGGKGWEPFEVVLVILLAAGLLTQFQNKSSGAKSTTNTTPKATTVTAPQPTDSCGLTVVSPRALEKVTSTVSLRGTTNGCNWPPTEGVALYAQVIDSYGKPVSAYTAVPGVLVGDGSTSFDMTISLSAKPKGKGFIILVPTSSSTTQSITTRIPITFTP